MFDDVFPLFKLKTNQRIKYKEKENNFCKKKITFYLVNESKQDMSVLNTLYEVFPQKPYLSKN